MTLPSIRSLIEPPLKVDERLERSLRDESVVSNGVNRHSSDRSSLSCKAARAASKRAQQPPAMDNLVPGGEESPRCQRIEEATPHNDEPLGESDTPVVALQQHPRVAGFRINGLLHRRAKPRAALSLPKRRSANSIGDWQVPTVTLQPMAQAHLQATQTTEITSHMQGPPTVCHLEVPAVASAEREQKQFAAEPALANSSMERRSQPQENSHPTIGGEDVQVLVQEPTGNDAGLQKVQPACVEIQTDRDDDYGGQFTPPLEEWQRVVVTQLVHPRQLNLSGWRQQQSRGQQNERGYAVQLRHHFPGEHLLNNSKCKVRGLARGHDIVTPVTP